MATDLTTELMERVLQESGGNFLSDLHVEANAGRVMRAVRAIPAEDYPTETWAQLANYIAGGQRSYDDAGAAIEALLTHLNSYL